MADTVLVLDNLHKSFGALRATDGVDLELKHGEIHALIGPNGAGKSTLINLTAGAIRPDSGAVRFLGRDVTALSSDAHIEDAAQLMIERKVGCVPVIDDGELVGIVTETDLLEVMVEVFGSLRSSAVIEVEIRGGQEELDGLLQSIAKSGATVLSVGQTEGASGRTHRYSIRVRPREIAERVIGVIEEDGHRVLSVID